MKRKYLLFPLLILLIILTIFATDNMASKNIKIEDVEFESNGRNLKALYSYPNVDFEEGSLPGVVVFHGFSASKEMMRPFTEGLARLGFGVLTVDQQGHGLSDGYLGEDGENSLRNDGISAVNYLKSITDIDNNRIGLVGHSMGGGTTFSTALYLEDQIDASVVIGNTLNNIDQSKVNASNPSNLMIALGEYDELFDYQDGIDTMKSIVGSDVREDVTYGNFSQGTARKIIVESTDHILEVLNTKIIKQTFDWFYQSLITSKDVNPVILYEELNANYFIIDQLMSLIAGILLIAILPIILFNFPGNNQLKETKIKWVIHGIVSVFAFLVGSLSILFSPGSFAFLFVGWMIIGSILYYLLQYYEKKKYSENVNLKKLLKMNFQTDKSEILVTSLTIIILFTCVQFCLWFIHWDFRYMLPMFAAINLRRLPIFLLIFLPGIIFFTIDINTLGGTNNPNIKELMREILARTWPFLLVLLIQYLPLFIFSEPIVPTIVGFISFFLLGFIPIMLIISVINFYKRKYDYRPLSIAIWSAFIIAWILSSTVPFVSNSPI